MADRSLEDLLGTVESPVELLRNSQAGPNVYPGVPAEYTNWRDEQIAWQTSCVLFNQSYHMADLAVEGPDAAKLLSRLAVNSFEGFTVDKAKHFVPCTPDGYVIGDVILFHLAENSFQSRRPRARAELDHLPRRDRRRTTSCGARPALGPTHRRAPPLLPVPDPGPERDAGDREGARWAGPGAQVLQHDHDHDRRAARACPPPRHGRPARLGALRPVGGRARRCTRRCSRRGRSSGCGRSAGGPTRRTRSSPGGSPRRCPAVYSGESLKAYREWLPADGLRGLGLDRRQLRLGRRSRTTT